MNSYKINLIDKTSVDLIDTSVTLQELKEMIFKDVCLIVNNNALINLKYVVSIKQVK